MAIGGSNGADRSTRSADNERIRFELLSIVLGVWDYIKNSGEHPDQRQLGAGLGRHAPRQTRSRRLVGDHLLTQHDLMGLNGEMPDAVCIGGWPMDDHPPAGFDDPEKPPLRLDPPAGVYNIPLR